LFWFARKKKGLHVSTIGFIDIYIIKSVQQIPFLTYSNSAHTSKLTLPVASRIAKVSGRVGELDPIIFMHRHQSPFFTLNDTESRIEKAMNSIQPLFDN
jgi:hypothetical protein